MTRKQNTIITTLAAYGPWAFAGLGVLLAMGGVG